MFSQTDDGSGGGIMRAQLTLAGDWAGQEHIDPPCHPSLLDPCSLQVSLGEDLAAALTDGVVLCHIANHVSPRAVSSIHVPSPAVVSLHTHQNTQTHTPS